MRSAPLLNLSMIDGLDPVRPGDTLTYTLAYSNEGGANAVATNVVVRETYDGNVTFLNAEPPPDAGDDEWWLGDLHPGDSGTITVEVQAGDSQERWPRFGRFGRQPDSEERLTDGTQLANIAVIESDQGNASAEENTVIDSDARLNLEVRDSADPAAMDSELTFVIDYSNGLLFNGRSTNVVLRLTYDPHTSFLFADVPPDAGTDDQWSLGDLWPGQRGRLSVTVQVDAVGQLNTGFVLSSDQGTAKVEEITIAEIANKELPENCPAEIAVGGWQRDNLIALLYDFRDRVLPTLPEGAWLRETYYRHANEVGLRLLADSSLRNAALRILQYVRGRLEMSVDRGELLLTRSQLRSITSFATQLKRGSSTQLETDLQRFIEMLRIGNPIAPRQIWR